MRMLARPPGCAESQVCLYDSGRVKNVPSVWAGGELSSRKRPSWHLNSDLCFDPWEKWGASEDMPVSQTASYNTAAKNTLWHTMTRTHKKNSIKKAMQKFTYISCTKTHIAYTIQTHTPWEFAYRTYGLRNVELISFCCLTVWVICFTTLILKW